MTQSYGKPRGRVNQGGATHEKDRERLAKLGKNYNSIDFTMSDSLKDYNFSDKSVPIGTLEVGRTTIELTWSECNKVMEILKDAQATHRQKIKLGMF